MMLLEPLLHSDKIRFNRDQFCAKVRAISKKLGIDPDWLMHAMWFESKLNHQAQNPYTKATGLIQFMPATARSLGTSTANLVNMTNVEQLDYVYEYLKSYSWDLSSAVDVYLAIFFPAAIGKPKEWVIQTSKLSAGLIAKQNPVFDRNKDYRLTVQEVQEKYLESIPSQYMESFKKK